jgi:predicted metal-dependent hydrolase
MNIQSILLNQEQYPVHIEKKKVRRIIIKVNPANRIFLTCPTTCPLAVAMDYLEQHRSWLEKVVSTQQENRREMRVDEFFDRKITYLRGQVYTLVRDENLSFPYQIQEDRIIYRGDPEKILERIRKEHYSDLEASFQRCLHSFAGHIRQKPFLVISKMRTRWGSCNYKTGRIAINRMLVHLPPDLVHCIMLHEFVHLLYPNHSRSFHAFLKECLPDYRQAEKRLKKYAFLLQTRQ